MCEKCVELDRKIEHYKRIRLSMVDQVTIDRIEEFIKELKAQKAEFHLSK